MAFRWRADDGPLIVLFESTQPSSTKKKQKKVKVGPPQTKFSGSAHGVCKTLIFGGHFDLALEFGGINKKHQNMRLRNTVSDSVTQYYAIN